MFRSVVVAAGLALGVAPSVSALTFLVPETEETAVIDLVIAEATGGFSVYAGDGGIHRFDGSGRLLASDVLARPTVPGGSILNWPGRLRGHPIGPGHQLMVIDDSLSKWPEGTPGPIDYSHICTIDRFDGGRVLTRIWLSASLHAIRTTTTVDGKGGMWVLFHGGELVRFAADCQATEMGSVAGDVERMEADRQGRAVYLHTADHRLIHVSMDGGGWTVALPHAGRMAALESGGVVINFWNSIDGGTLIAFDSAGRERWRRPGYDHPFEMMALGTGIILATYYDAIILDDQGNEKVRFTDPDINLVWQLVPSASSQTAWVMFYSSNPDSMQLVGLDASTGTARVWEVEWDFVPVAALADQNMVLVRGANFPHWGDPGHRVYVTSGGTLRKVGLPPAGLGDRLLALSTDIHGAVALIAHDQGWTVIATDASLVPKWKEWLATDQEVIHLNFQMALGEQQVCVLASQYSRVKGESRVWLQCHERHSGKAGFAQKSFPAVGAFLRPDIGHFPEIMYFDELAGVMRHVLIEAGGTLAEAPSRFNPMVPHSFFRINQMVYLDDGSLILRWQFPEVIQFLPADPEEEIGGVGFDSSWQSSFRGSVLDPDTMVFAHDRLVVLGGRSGGKHDELVMFSRLGKYLGTIKVSVDHGYPLRRRSVAATPTGWQVAYLTEEYLFVRHYSVDGHETDAPVRVRINLPEPGENDLAGRYILGTSENELVVVLPKATATRIHWIDPVRGVITASASTQLLPSYAQSIDVVASDQVVIAGEAPGNGARRLALWHGQAHVRQLIAQLPPSNFSGAWFDPSMSGQGFFLDYVESADLLFGAWFTFGTDGGYLHEGLRWYTFAGQPAGAGQAVEAVLYLNRNGRFDQGPVTSSIPVGRVRIWQVSGSSLQFTVQFEGQAEDGLSMGHELKRVLAAGGLHGVRQWFDPATSGQGILLADPVEVDGALFGGWFTYDVSGQADDEHAHHWFVLFGEPGSVDGFGARETRIYRTTGGRLGTRGTSSIDAVGTATLTPLFCDRLELNYRFDATETAGSFAGRQGQKTLRAIPGCP